MLTVFITYNIYVYVYMCAHFNSNCIDSTKKPIDFNVVELVKKIIHVLRPQCYICKKNIYGNIHAKNLKS